ncbi:LysR family transcriptional regulator [Aquamicrobium sp. LC103]|uniref:LysR family transcriptional regulator n=1 Tax=Aquamicrobium sp. LC103 TaxID=1120658 RepID=UPI00063EBF70|nr:LysR family transcriptional regulator [Aquamicrobium sp. LC103]TKT76236.1 LysR family transcriptional regulator [Aquamicrobium sp. LC103]
MPISITLKQLEALYWITKLGTFERAAAKLNTTQSAVSKRIQELELATGIAVFDRSQRGARLTERGEHLLAIGEEMLGLHDRIAELKDSRHTPLRRLRIGVTELTAMTWLPRLVTALRETYPSVSLEPEVDMSRNLYERLVEETIDLIVIPEAFTDPEISAVHLADVSNVWMAKPGLVNIGEPLYLAELANYPILTQGGRSGSGLYFNKWLKAEGVTFPKVLSSDSLTALLGLTIAGLGVSYVPEQCFQPLVDEGKLVVIPTKPSLPPVPYVSMFRNDRPSAVTSAIAELTMRVCDFSRQFQS